MRHIENNTSTPYFGHSSFCSSLKYCDLHYELTNHLGNVLATVSDRKILGEVAEDFIGSSFEPGDLGALSDINNAIIPWLTTQEARSGTHSLWRKLNVTPHGASLRKIPIEAGDMIEKVEVYINSSGVVFPGGVRIGKAITDGATNILYEDDQGQVPASTANGVGGVNAWELTKIDAAIRNIEVLDQYYYQNGTPADMNDLYLFVNMSLSTNTPPTETVWLDDVKVEINKGGTGTVFYTENTFDADHGTDGWATCGGTLSNVNDELKIEVGTNGTTICAQETMHLNAGEMYKCSFDLTNISTPNPVNIELDGVLYPVQEGINTINFIPTNDFFFMRFSSTGTTGDYITVDNFSITSGEEICSSLRFDGSGLGDKVTIPGSSSLAFGTGDFTIEGWIKPELGGNGGFLPILSSRPSATFASGIFFAVLPSNGSLFLQIGGNHTTSCPNVIDGNWHHVALVRQGIDVFMYVDGLPCDTIMKTTVNLTATDFVLGKESFSSTNTYSGGMDEFRIWNIARTESDLQNYMNKALIGNETGLVAYYRMNEGMGTLLNDLTANANDGALGSGAESPVWSTDAQVCENNNVIACNSLAFDGVNDYVSLSSINTGTGPFTIEAWINPADVAGATPIWGMGVVRNTNNDQAGDWVLAVGNDGSLLFYNWLVNGTDLTGRHVTAPGLIQNNQWYHVVATWDGNINKIYINGQEQSFSNFSTSSGWLVGQEIGRSYTGSSRHFDGKIDEVRIWNVARTQAQIEANYNLALSGSETGMQAYYRMNKGTGTTLIDLSVNANHGTFASGSQAPQWSGEGQACLLSPIFSASNENLAYLAQVTSAQDYYPFGMVKPNETNVTNDYSYAFNGMETDDEISGNDNVYTTQFRQYDPRLGRWMSVDPLMSKFPSWSPYNFNFNNPVNFVDIYGNGPGESKEGTQRATEANIVDGKDSRSYAQVPGEQSKGDDLVDCSEFCREIASIQDYDPGRDSRTQADYYRKNGQFSTNIEDVEVGDFVFWKTSGGTRIDHTGVVTDVNEDGSFRVVHATVNKGRPGSIKATVTNADGSLWSGTRYTKVFIGTGRPILNNMTDQDIQDQTLAKIDQAIDPITPNSQTGTNPAVSTPINARPAVSSSRKLDLWWKNTSNEWNQFWSDFEREVSNPHNWINQ